MTKKVMTMSRRPYLRLLGVVLYKSYSLLQHTLEVRAQLKRLQDGAHPPLQLWRHLFRFAHCSA